MLFPTTLTCKVSLLQQHFLLLIKCDTNYMNVIITNYKENLLSHSASVIRISILVYQCHFEISILI